LSLARTAIAWIHFNAPLGACKARRPTERLIRRSRSSKGENMNLYIEVLKKYAVFNGRAARKEYWYFILFSILINFLLTIVASIIQNFSPGVSAALLGIYYLAMLIPWLSASVRRLHDTSHSGWWILLILVPLVGPLVLLIFMVQDSQANENQYGPNPKLAEHKQLSNAF
jgi:uncharacterized membrane protein YhaH (DUF805 family)